MFIFREEGYFNMTEAAKRFGKHLVNFWNHSATVEYVKALEETLEANVSLTEAKRGSQLRQR